MRQTLPFQGNTPPLCLGHARGKVCQLRPMSGQSRWGKRPGPVSALKAGGIMPLRCGQGSFPGCSAGLAVA